MHGTAASFASVIASGVEGHNGAGYIGNILANSKIPWLLVFRRRCASHIGIIFRNSGDAARAATLLKTGAYNGDKRLSALSIVVLRSAAISKWHTLLFERKLRCSQQNCEAWNTDLPRSASKIPPVLSVIAPYFFADGSMDNEGVRKAKMIRGKLSKRFAKVLRGQVVNPGPKLTHNPPRLMPRWLTNLEYKSAVMGLPAVAQPPVQRNYRTKAEFSVGMNPYYGKTLDTSMAHRGFKQMHVGPCKRYNTSFYVYSVDEWRDAGIFPPAFATLASHLEDTLNPILLACRPGRVSCVDKILMRSAGLIHDDAAESCYRVQSVLCGIYFQHLRNNSPSDDQRNPILDPMLLPNLVPFADVAVEAMRAFPTGAIALKLFVAIPPKEGRRHTFYMFDHADRIFKEMPSLSEAYVTQELLGLQFRIGPDTFFQSNISGAAMLFQWVCDLAVNALRARLAGIDAKEVRIYDICCGAGVIGQCLAMKLLSRLSARVPVAVTGVDISQDAIENARLNAEANEACLGAASVRCDYLASAAEHASTLFVAMPIDTASIGIVDPPRAGLHPSVIECLRCSTLRDIIYISCNPSSLARDLFLLCACTGVPTKKHADTAPFAVTSVQGVNMFPGCEHVETIVSLMRTMDVSGSLPASSAV